MMLPMSNSGEAHSMTAWICIVLSNMAGKTAHKKMVPSGRSNAKPSSDAYIAAAKSDLIADALCIILVSTVNIFMIDASLFICPHTLNGPE